MTVETIYIETAKQTSKHMIQAAAYGERRALYEASAGKEGYDKAVIERRTAEIIHRRIQNANRPSVFMCADIHRVEQGDRIVYCASYSGLDAYGDTPEMAFDNFDRIWAEGEKS